MSNHIYDIRKILIDFNNHKISFLSGQNERQISSQYVISILFRTEIIVTYCDRSDKIFRRLILMRPFNVNQILD